MGNHVRLTAVKLRIALAVLGIALAIALCEARPHEVRVRVLNYDTERPVAGAVVAVRWYSPKLLCIHGDCVDGVAGVTEVRTGNDGIAVARGPWRRVAAMRDVVVHKAGFVVASTRNSDYFLLSPNEFAAGPAMLSEDVRQIAADLPLFSAEVRKTMAITRHP